MRHGVYGLAGTQAAHVGEARSRAGVYGCVCVCVCVFVFILLDPAVQPKAKSWLAVVWVQQSGTFCTDCQEKV